MQQSVASIFGRVDKPKIVQVVDPRLVQDEEEGGEIEIEEISVVLDIEVSEITCTVYQ